MRRMNGTFFQAAASARSVQQKGFGFHKQARPMEGREVPDFLHPVVRQRRARVFVRSKREGPGCERSMVGFSRSEKGPRGGTKRKNVQAFAVTKNKRAAFGAPPSSYATPHLGTWRQPTSRLPHMTKATSSMRFLLFVSGLLTRASARPLLARFTAGNPFRKPIGPTNHGVIKVNWTPKGFAGRICRTTSFRRPGPARMMID